MEKELYKYLAYKPKEGDALIKVGRETIYSIGNMALCMDTERYLVDVTWIPNMSWMNDTDVAQTYKHTFTTQLKITKGSEENVKKGFSLPSTYTGVSINFENHTKTFKTTETSETKTIELSISVPPRAHLVFYQRKYTFRDSMLSFFKAGNKEWSIGTGGGSEPATKDFEVEIMSEEYATLSNELDGSTTGTISVTTVEPASKAQRGRDIPRQARIILQRMGV